MTENCSPRVTPFFKKRGRHEYEQHRQVPLIDLCRERKLPEVLRRCRSHPTEAIPQPIIPGRNRLRRRHAWKNRAVTATTTLEDEQIFEDTALGIVCVSEEVDSDLFMKVVTALIQACPCQVRASQRIAGHTPLRDAILNPSCSARLLRLLVECDLDCDSKFYNIKSALDQKDRNLLFPIDHVVNRVQLGAHIQALDLLQTFLCLKREAHGSFDWPTSPLIRLLALGASSVCETQYMKTSSLISTRSSALDLRRHQGVHQAATILLEQDPSLLYHSSEVTGCSPLHVGLRNFGSFAPLINELVSRDVSGRNCHTQNKFGDLPLHIACSVGVSMTLLKAITQKMRSTCPQTSRIDHPLSTTNLAGYTPIDLEWVHYIESGNGLLSTKALCPLEPPNTPSMLCKRSEYCKALLREAADQVLGSGVPVVDNESEKVDEVFGGLLERLTLLLASNLVPADSVMEVDTALHLVCRMCSADGLCIPFPLFEVYLHVHSSQVTRRDCTNNLPIHHILSSSFGRANAAHHVVESCDKWRAAAEKLLTLSPNTASEPNSDGRLPLHLILCYRRPLGQSKSISSARGKLIETILECFPDASDARDPVTGLYPFMLAAQDSDLPLDTLFCLLRHSPSRCGTH